MQADLDAYLKIYNRNRRYRRRREGGMEGRTPHEVFSAGLPNAKKAAKQKPREEAT